MGRILVAIAAIALAVFFRVEAADYRIAASRLPDVVGAVLILLSVMLIVQVLMSWRKASAQGELTIFPKVEPRAILLGVAFIVLIFAYAWSIQTIGYLVATPVFLLVVLVVLRPIHWLWTIVITATVTLVIWAIFIYFLKMPILLYPGS
ncbi:Tripartite tricarboxylate transporter TctB family protein [Modicisalibacter muralis]|uniref:Tripartite tricarboxylate transporter TctB family protein n=1 Tax=Modicisalibacter muralis TaxID=119000 RepID=A0A1G9KMR1_9GAMM|nr:tripartite tricarboxylate transporter TctB family protein [Halomonas muralis]SDL51048.1 Tripartite tricarboxylate transporter TctB family protein [Halomonas muralis]